VGEAADKQQVERPERWRPTSLLPLKLRIINLLIGSGLTAFLALTLLFLVERGSAVRPIGHMLLVLLIGMIWFGLGIAELVLAWCDRKFALGLVCLLLGLLPIPVGLIVFNAVMAWHQLTLAP